MQLVQLYRVQQTVRAPPVLLPLLVLDKFMRVDPEWPFDVANTAAV